MTVPQSESNGFCMHALLSVFLFDIHHPAG
jgi:hypothetical protein